MKRGVYYLMVILGVLSCSVPYEKSEELGVDFTKTTLSTNNLSEATEGEKYIDNYEAFLYCRSTSSVLFSKRYKRGLDREAYFTRWTLDGVLPDDYNLLILTNSSAAKTCVESGTVASGKFVVSRDLSDVNAIPTTICATFSGSTVTGSSSYFATARVRIRDFAHRLEDDADDMEVYSVWLGDATYACDYDVDMSVPSIAPQTLWTCNENGEIDEVRDALYQTVDLTLSEGEDVEQETLLYFFPHGSEVPPTRLVVYTSRGYYNVILPDVEPGQSIEINQIIFKGEGGVRPYDPGILELIFETIDVRPREDMGEEVVVR